MKYEFPGKKLLDGFIELPFALPTAVAGITLSKLYSESGLFGRFLKHLGIQITYTRLGLVIALIFVGIPFVVRAVQPVLEKMDDQYEEAAYMLGGKPEENLFRRDLTGASSGTAYRIRTGICQRDWRVRKCDLHIRKQCQRAYTSCVVCDHAEAELH